jgi:tetratricopeptide (TPR) repeat protein
LGSAGGDLRANYLRLDQGRQGLAGVPFFVRGPCVKIAARAPQVPGGIMITAVRAAGRMLALLLVLAPLVLAWSALPVRAAEPKVKIVAFGLWGDQDVFETEAKGAAQIMSQFLAGRFGSAPTVVRFNSKSQDDATPKSLAAALQSSALGMDAERDVLIVILTSHGSPAGIGVKTPSREGVISPLELFVMLDATHVRHRVVIVSACYSGVFIPPLADPDTLIITAADADHPSFGCQNGAGWTYFGDAFFNTALRRTANLREAYTLASAAIRKRELKDHFVPSNPQMAGGENVERILAGTPQGDAPVPIDARYAPAFTARGDAYVGRRDFNDALAAYSEAIQLDPKYTPAYSGRGNLYRAHGDLEPAMADANRAIALDPKFADAYNARGAAYMTKGEKDRAIADFDQAIALDPKRFVVYVNRGIAYADKGDNDKAIADYGIAIKLEPRYYGAYFERGVAFSAKGDSNRAITDFSQAIKLNPKDADAFDNRGLAYRAKGDIAHADADAREAARLKAAGVGP